MAGRATIHSWDEHIIQNSYLLSDNFTFINLQNPLNLYSNIRLPAHKQRLGPGYTFAEYFRNTSVYEQFGMILNARGGTNMSMCWTKGKFENNCYQESITRIQEFQKKFPDYPIKGIIWHQGENDCIPVKNPNYMKELVQFISDVREDLGINDLPFVAGQLGMFNGNFTEFNNKILELPKLVKNSAVVSSVGLKDRGDLLHFDWESQHEFGVRYAKAMINLLNPK